MTEYFLGFRASGRGKVLAEKAVKRIAAQPEMKIGNRTVTRAPPNAASPIETPPPCASDEILNDSKAEAGAAGTTIAGSPRCARTAPAGSREALRDARAVIFNAHEHVPQGRWKPLSQRCVRSFCRALSMRLKRRGEVRGWSPSTIACSLALLIGARRLIRRSAAYLLIDFAADDLLEIKQFFNKFVWRRRGLPEEHRPGRRINAAISLIARSRSLPSV